MKVNLKYKKIKLGDGLSVCIKPLTSYQLQRTGAIFQQAEDGNMLKILSDEVSFEFLKTIIIANSKDLVGLTIEDEAGEHQATITEALDISEFFTYTVTILTKLMELSNPTKEDIITIKKQLPSS